jgi:predicted adenylyl cyclase CyaB
MLKNIEIKVKLSCESKFIETIDKAHELCSNKKEYPQLLLQKDTFFNCKVGRMKLRVLGNNKEGTLISYMREDVKDKPKLSSYLLYETLDANKLCDTLEKTCGIKGIVKKRRILYVIGQTRIHLDEIKDLGYFMELEVVLKKDQEEQEGIDIAQELMNKLEIDKKDLIDVAYIDLLNNQMK